MAVGPDARAAGPGPARVRPYFTNIAGRTQLCAAGPPFEMRPIAIAENIKRRDGIYRILSSAAAARRERRQAARRPPRLIRRRSRAAADNIGLFPRMGLFEYVLFPLYSTDITILWGANMRVAAGRAHGSLRADGVRWLYQMQYIAFKKWFVGRQLMCLLLKDDLHQIG